MSVATAPCLEVCPEYQLLLQRCQKALSIWQQQHSLATRSPLALTLAAEELQRLQANYTNAYAQLETHERSCSTCQYVSKIAGLDFESLSDALIQSHPPR